MRQSNKNPPRVDSLPLEAVFMFMHVVFKAGRSSFHALGKAKYFLVNGSFTEKTKSTEVDDELGSFSQLLEGAAEASSPRPDPIKPRPGICRSC